MLSLVSHRTPITQTRTALIALLTLRWFGMLVLLALHTTTFMPVASAHYTITGTPTEMQTIQNAINDITAHSTTANRLFNELQARPEDVTIGFGDAPDIGLATSDNKMVILNKAAIDSLKQIGSGRALEETSLGKIIAHEALGHILNGLKKSPNGEDVAMSVERMISADLGSPKRTAYRFPLGGKDTIPYNDGSFVDTTDAFKQAKHVGGPHYARIQQNASLNLIGTLMGGALNGQTEIH